MSNIERRLIRRREVEQIIGRSTTWIYEQLADPASDFPRPIHPLPGVRSVLWVASEVEDYVAKRADGVRAVTPRAKRRLDESDASRKAAA